jgi:hypothetical protein
LVSVKALMVFSAFEEEVWLQLRPQVLETRLDQPSFEIGGLHRQRMRLAVALPHLCRVVSRNGPHRR